MPSPPTSESAASIEYEFDYSHDSDETVKDVPISTEAMWKYVSLKKQNKRLLRKLTEAFQKSQEELILGLQAIIASLEATIKRTFGEAASPPSIPEQEPEMTDLFATNKALIQLHNNTSYHEINTGSFPSIIKPPTYIYQQQLKHW